MGRVSSLYNIIRQVESDAIPLAAGESLVRFNPAKKVAITGKTWFQHVNFYVVTTKRIIDYESTHQTIRSRRNRNDVLIVKPLCRLECPPGSETKLVEALGGGHSLEGKLDDLIASALNRFAENLTDDDPVWDFFRVREIWQRETADELRTMTGLEGEIELDVGDQNIGTINVNQDWFKVWIPEDRSEDLAAKVNTDLEPADGTETRTAAMLSIGRESTIQKKIMEAIQRWFPENVRNLTQYYEDGARIRQGIQDCVDQVAREFGRKVGRFEVNLKYPFERPRITKKTFEYDCKPRGATNPIKITHIVKLNRSDLSAYRRSKIKDLEEWIERTLGEITNDVVTQYGYKDLEIDYATDVSERIRRQFEQAADRIGFRLSQFESSASVQVPDVLVRPTLLNICHDVQIKDPVHVSVTHVVTLRLVDKSRYRGAAVTDIERWATAKLIDITQGILIDQTQRDVVLMFDAKLKSQIQQKFIAAADEIGFAVDKPDSRIKVERDPFVDASDDFHHTHRVSIKEWPREIEVKHHVHLKLNNHEVYLRSGPNDVQSWAKRNLEEITRRHFFGMTYIDVLMKFESEQKDATDAKGIREPVRSGSIEDNIRVEFQTRCSEIGFDVEQYSSVTEVKERFSKPIEFELKEKEYGTSDSREPVKLTIVVRARLPQDLKSIEAKLKPFLTSPDEDFKKQVEDETDKAVAQVMHEISAENFYLRFEEVPPLAKDKDGKVIDKPSVMQKIVANIESRLGEAFGIQKGDCRITVKQAATGLIRRHKELLGQGPYHFQLSVTPLDGRTAIEYKVSYEISGVVPELFSIFQNNEFHSVTAEIEKISRLMETAASSRLNRKMEFADLVRFRSEDLRRIVFDGIYSDDGKTKKVNGVYDLVARYHGLSVEVIGFERSGTLEEETRRRLAEAKLKTIEDIEKQRLEHLKREFSDNEDRARSIRAKDPGEKQLAIIEARQGKILDEMRTLTHGTGLTESPSVGFAVTKDTVLIAHLEQLVAQENLNQIGYQNSSKRSEDGTGKYSDVVDGSVKSRQVDRSGETGIE